MEKYDKYGGNVEENLVLRVGFLKSTWPSVLSAFIPLSALYAEAENMEIDFSFSLSYVICLISIFFGQQNAL